MKEELLQSKIALVDEIKEKIEKSQSIVLVNNHGLTVEEVTKLRKELREHGVDYKVYKNTMSTLPATKTPTNCSSAPPSPPSVLKMPFNRQRS